VDYVVSMLKKYTDYDIVIQPFQVVLSSVVAPSTLNLVSENRPLVANVDFIDMGGYGGLLNFTANITYGKYCEIVYLLEITRKGLRDKDQCVYKC
jgi:hypothetical protein